MSVISSRMPRDLGVLLFLVGCSEHKIAIHEEPPTAVILEPANNDSFVEGTPIAFRIQLDDMDDGVESLDVQIRSDLEGGLTGEGTIDDSEFNFIGDGLTLGTHTVKVEATDPSGGTGMDSVTINIVENTAPWIRIITPTFEQRIGDDQVFLVAIEAGDMEESAESLRLSWLLDDLPFGSGEVHPGVDGRASVDAGPLPLPAGVWDMTHTVRVEVMDTQGTTTESSVDIVVVPSDGDGDGAISTEVGGTDCDDDDARIYPGADEVCDEIDNDCDGLIDTDDPGLVDGITGHVDGDGDGFGVADATLTCDPNAVIEDGTDCDDADENIHPAATEVCDEIDNDCDALIDGDDPDTDGDGDGYSVCDDDCEDDEADINPGADEMCDEIDNDCDGTIDGPLSVDASTYYPDVDGDGFGDDDSGIVSCESLAPYIEVGGDCDDSEATVNPEAAEVCDALDNDCDTLVDGDDPDTDGDGDGFSSCGEDCDDDEADVHPDADEVCDDIDNDCDGVVDGPTAIDAESYFADADEDGFGDPDTLVVDCTIPAGATTDDTDCNDEAATANPDAPEICDGIDNDCDTLVDEDDPDTDVDDDGHSVCINDCDDDDPDVHPDADEVCDDIDNDCDDVIDGPTAVGAVVFYRDADEDDYGDPDESTMDCSPPDGFVDDDTDCNDADRYINPGAYEVCGDGLDNDCDGVPGDCLWEGDVPLENADRTVYGNDNADEMASSLAVADITGNGFNDMILGVSGVDSTASNSGTVYLLEGPLYAAVDNVEDVYDLRIDGNHNNGLLGHSMALFDLDVDESVDLIMGASEANLDGSNSGGVYIQYGPVTEGGSAADVDVIISGESEDDRFGYSISSGDLDGDGVVDLVVGAQRNDQHAEDGGAAYLYLGDEARWSSSITADTFDAKWASSHSDMYFGHTVVVPGDLNGDGRDDLLIGAPRNDDKANRAGAVFIVLGHATELGLGTTRLHTSIAGEYRGESNLDQVGTQIATLGDVDGDGRAEFMASSPYRDGDDGPNYGVVYGMIDPAVTGTHDFQDHADFIVNGDSENNKLGMSIDSAFDLDSDGISDLAIGASGENRGSSYQGVGYVIYGPITDLAGTYVLPGVDSAAFIGVTVHDNAGTLMVGGPDINNDGMDDLTVSAPRAELPGGTGSEGAVYTLFGRGF